jgi:excisionase family DNA binding protein
MPTTITPSVVPSSEMEALRNLQQELPEGSALGEALGKMSDGLQHGVAVTVASDDELLSPARAAAILGVSRTHLYKVLDAGALPFQVVGERDRRITVSDLNEFRARTMAFRQADAESIARRAQLEADILDEMD